ncbi:uncharacterized protein PITG_12282 [Phytophthora infestans T30-4]|uniref:Uncharacterized protein n=1 Tax=Phytophthora infestans (strain T30-4) TaxID=403677 RepID=D0NJH5_PHYIT|nr:uncharacterized protein PITG_12282 [Phytophthora infestans T30-4]EEY59693.1 conserved hypothetical protein [Phytophthora infestans T30-4]|eukprot:XP_002900886.1 conserved hypothetical protein [Phytophthora infestans T30-4]
MYAAKEARQGIRRATQARQPEGAEVSLPSNATFRQMQHLDAMRSPGRDGGHQEGGFRTLKVRLNGSSEMQLTIDIQELRTALGLPNYSLVADGIFSNLRPPQEPAVNMEDIDHQND